MSHWVEFGFGGISGAIDGLGSALGKLALNDRNSRATGGTSNSSQVRQVGKDLENK